MRMDEGEKNYVIISHAIAIIMRRVCIKSRLIGQRYPQESVANAICLLAATVDGFYYDFYRAQVPKLFCIQTLLQLQCFRHLALH